MQQFPSFEHGADRRNRFGSSSALLALAALLVCPVAAGAKTLMFAETVMSGLANPRGLTFGPDGALYVAEAGSGGPGPTITAGSGEILGYGTTGAISRLQDGLQERFVSGLPSFAGTSGEEAHGPQELAFGSDGRLYATMGLGANPAELANVAGQPAAELAGTVAVIDGGVPQVFADVAAFEAANDVDGNVPDSNVYGIVPMDDGFRVTDAGGNAVLSVDAAGTVELEVVIPNEENPLEFGPETYQAVPTGAALGPGGEFVFGQLTGFPFVPGAAQIFSLDGDSLSVVAGGLTNVINVAFGPDGQLFALELDSDGLLGPGTTGSIYSIALDGSKRLLLDDLERPTGMAVGPGGTLYVSVDGFSSNAGSVVRLAPVPLPAALPAAASGLALLAALRLRRRRSARG